MVAQEVHNRKEVSVRADLKKVGRKVLGDKACTIADSRQEVHITSS